MKYLKYLLFLLFPLVCFAQSATQTIRGVTMVYDCNVIINSNITYSLPGISSTWTNIVVPWTSVTNGFATNTVTLLSLPASNYIDKVVVLGRYVTTNSDDVVIRVGLPSDTDRLTGNISVSVTNSGQAPFCFGIFDAPSSTEATNIVMTIQRSSTNATLQSLAHITNGIVNVFISKGSLP